SVGGKLYNIREDDMFGNTKSSMEIERTMKIFIIEDGANISSNSVIVITAPINSAMVYYCFVQPCVVYYCSDPFSHQVLPATVPIREEGAGKNNLLTGNVRWVPQKHHLK
nr:hypothetical protein [Tanacetum cinerariifolium]